MPDVRTPARPHAAGAKTDATTSNNTTTSNTPTTSTTARNTEPRGTTPRNTAPLSTTRSYSEAGATGSSDGRAASGPSASDLLDFVHHTAADTALLASLPLDPEGRTWIRLDGPGGSEAWLIGWPPGTGTGWHDHGGSHGAFATALGALTEQSLTAQLPTEGWRTLELADDVDRERTLSDGRGRAFGPHHVHQVLNTSEDTHAVSVHAYYPPLPMMRRYSRTGAVLRLEEVERPEEWL